MGRLCAAACCKEEVKKDSPYSFHKFPTEPKIRQQWAVKVNRETRNEKGKRVQWQPADHDVLCSKHFIESCFTDRTILSRKMNLPYRPYLREDAVPTIFMHSYAKRKKEEEYAAKRSAVAEKKRKTEVSAKRQLMLLFRFYPQGFYITLIAVEKWYPYDPYHVMHGYFANLRFAMFPQTTDRSS